MKDQLARARKKQLKSLSRTYKKQLKRLWAYGLEDPVCSCLEYFVTYLQYLRDYFFISDGFEPEEENWDITSLTAALDEYAAYRECIFKYYTVNEQGLAVPKAENASEETLDAYSKEIATHWHYFWKIVEGNIEDWLNNASI